MRKTEKAHLGQTIITESSPDPYSSHKLDETRAIRGKKMGGGPSDLSHSLPGATATGDYRGERPRRGG
jgi:hypothetical protein